MQLHQPSLVRAAVFALAFAGAAGAETAQAWNNVGAAALTRGDYAAAEAAFTNAIREWQKLPESVGYAITLRNCAVLYGAIGRLKDAATAARRALAMVERLTGPSSLDSARALNTLAYVYRLRKEYGQAEETARRAVDLAAAEDPGGRNALVANLNTLGVTLWEEGQEEEARRVLDRARAALGADDPNLAPVLNTLALIEIRRHNYAAAEELASRAESLWERDLGPDHPYVASALNNWAQSLRLSGRLETAEPLYSRAVVILRRQPAPCADLGRVLGNLAALHHARGEESRAVALYLDALAILEKALGGSDPEVADLLYQLAKVRRAQGHYSESARLYRRALGILERAAPPNDPRLAEARAGYLSLRTDPHFLDATDK